MIVSDGYETGDAARAGAARWRHWQSAGRRIVCHPIMAWDCYAPEAAGIKAALRMSISMRTANTLKSLTRL